MTYDTLNRDRENAGSVSAVSHKIDITALDDTGTENYDPEDVGISGADRYGVSVVGQEATDKHIVWDPVDGSLSVRELGTGDNTATGTAVGEVILEVKGV